MVPDFAKPGKYKSADAQRIVECRGIHHIGIRVRDVAAAARFYSDLLGLVQHPEKTNLLGWPGVEHDIHLMPSDEEQPPASVNGDLARHLAIEVDDLEAAAARLLSRGLSPFRRA